MAVCVCWASPHLWAPDSCVQLLIWHCALDINRNFQLEFQCTSLNNFHLTPNLFCLCIFLSLWKSPASVTQKNPWASSIILPFPSHHTTSSNLSITSLALTPKYAFVCLFVCFDYLYLIRSFVSWWYLVNRWIPNCSPWFHSCLVKICSLPIAIEIILKSQGTLHFLFPSTFCR